MRTLTIFGRRWFQRSTGNTYFSAYALIDGQPAEVRIHEQYGYGNHYEYAMFSALVHAGLLPYPVERFNNGGSETPWSYCADHGIKYATDVTDVGRRKDL